MKVGSQEAAEEAVATGVWSRELLCYAEAEEMRLRFLYFWSHVDRRGQGVGRHVLSQWYEHAFDVDGVTYRTAEHFMMAEKARLFGDESSAERIVAAKSPGEAKALGRGVRGFSDSVWREHRLHLVTRASLAKFSSSPELETYLVGTIDNILVEASPTDTVWGIGLAADDQEAQSPARWRGENLLGLALMQARQQLRSSGSGRA